MAIDEHDGAGASITRDLPRRLVPGPSDELGATTPGARGLAFADEMPARAGQIGRFIVLRRIGAGGMGVVYLAYDNALDRRVAVKLIRSLSAPDPETTARMRREAQGMARLSHPNVLQIYETGESDGSLFLAMEYVRGGSLAAWLARRSEAQQADWRASVAIFVQAGRGLAAAHQAGLVHRDFKPENVLVDDDGVARVGDFGLVRALTDDEPAASRSHARGPLLATTLTATRGVMGTPAYMSPEQHAGLTTDARTDQFSFCVALWEALYGERPFAGETLDELAEAIDRGVPRPAPPGTRVPAWLRAALTRGLAAAPDNRWPTMPALLAVLCDDPDARRRRRLLLGAAALTLAATIAVLVLATLRDRQRADDATRQAEVAARRTEQVSDERDQALARATREATRARDTLRMAALQQIDRDPTRAALVLQEVEDPAHTPEWTQHARATLAAPIRAAVLRGHANQITGAAFIDDDDARVVTVSIDRSARVWRRDGVGDPQLLAHDKPLDGVVVGPDRRRFVTLGDPVARVWDAPPGQPVALLTTLPGPDETERAAFTPDGQRLAVVDRTGAVRLWSLADGRLLAELGTHATRVFALAFDPTGQHLVTGDNEGQVIEWRGDGGPPRRLPPLRDLITDLHLGADASMIVASEASVELWSAARPPRRRSLRGHTDTIAAAVLSPDGRELATASRDGSVRLWDPDSARELARIDHKDPVSTVTYSPDGRWLATLADDAVRLWRRDDHHLVHALHGSGGPEGAQFSRDSAHLLTFGDEHEAHVWDLRDLGDTRLFRAPSGPLDRAYGGCDVGRVAALGHDGALHLWDCEGTRPPTTIQLSATPVFDLDLDPTLTHGFYANELAVWRVDLPAGPPRQVGVHPRLPWRVAPSPDGRHLVSTGYDHTARVWDLAGQRPPIALVGHLSPLVWDVAWSPDGATLATIGNDTSVRVWPIGPVLLDSQQRELQASQTLLGHTRGAKTLAWSPDGARLLTSSPDATARIWDPAGVAPPVVLAGHRGAIHAAEWSPDGAHVATASEDGTARIWQLDGITPPQVLRGHRDELATIAWSPDGRALVTASSDGTARIWDPDTGLAGDVFAPAVAVLSAQFTRDGAQVLLALADDTVRLWRPDLDTRHDPPTLLARLRAATTSCLTARDRELLLLEDAALALATHAACEARHGRTPDEGSSPPQSSPASASPAGASQSKAG